MKMKMRILTVALIAGLALTGCTQAPDTEPFDVAWATCVQVNDDIYPDGMVDARDGQLLDSEEICHSTVATQGKEEFTEFFTTPERWQKYRDAQLRDKVG